MSEPPALPTSSEPPAPEPAPADPPPGGSLLLPIVGLGLGFLTAGAVLALALAAGADGRAGDLAPGERSLVGWTSPTGERLRLLGRTGWPQPDPLPPAPEGALPEVAVPARALDAALRAINQNPRRGPTAAADAAAEVVAGQGWDDLDEAGLLRLVHALAARAPDRDAGGAAAILGGWACARLAERGSLAFLPYASTLLHHPYAGTRLEVRGRGSRSVGPSAEAEVLAQELAQVCASLGALDGDALAQAAEVFARLAPRNHLPDPGPVHALAARGAPEVVFPLLAAAFDAPVGPADPVELLGLLVPLTGERPDCQAFWAAQLEPLSAQRPRPSTPAAPFQAFFLAEGLRRAGHPDALAKAQAAHAQAVGAERAALAVVLRRLGSAELAPVGEGPGEALGVVVCGGPADDAERGALERAFAEPYPFHRVQVPGWRRLEAEAKAALSDGPDASR
jgi:hypothetical protein